MDSVPMPQILDPERLRAPDREEMTVDEHRDRAARFHAELVNTCEYGQALWHELSAVREYLSEHTPDAGADDEAWSAWARLYGSATSSLAGTKGDDGFGAQEAQLIATRRRSGG